MAVSSLWELVDWVTDIVFLESLVNNTGISGFSITIAVSLILVIVINVTKFAKAIIAVQKGLPDAGKHLAMQIPLLSSFAVCFY